MSAKRASLTLSLAMVFATGGLLAMIGPSGSGERQPMAYGPGAAALHPWGKHRIADPKDTPQQMVQPTKQIAQPAQQMAQPATSARPAPATGPRISQSQVSLQPPVTLQSFVATRDRSPAPIKRASMAPAAAVPLPPAIHAKSSAADIAAFNRWAESNLAANQIAQKMSAPKRAKVAVAKAKRPPAITANSTAADIAAFNEWAEQTKAATELAALATGAVAPPSITASSTPAEIAAYNRWATNRAVAAAAAQLPSG
jgi:hypothetical protein